MGQTAGEMMDNGASNTGYEATHEANDAASSGSDSGTHETAEIRAQIEQTRSEMSETIDAIQDKLSPETLKEQAQQMVHEATVGRAQEMVNNVGDTAKGFGSNMLDTIKENPLPAALAAFGIAWLVNKNASKPPKREYYGPRYRPEYLGYEPTPDAYYSRSRYDQGGVGGTVDQARAKVGDVAEGAGDTVSRATQKAGDTVGQAAQKAGDTLNRATQTAGDTIGAIGDQAQYRAEQTTDWFQRVMYENPLAVGIAGVAIGAAIGMMLPETQQEHQIMGPARDNLMDKAQEAAQTTVDKVQRVASEAQNAAQREAENQGLAPSGDGQQVGAEQIS